MNHNGWLSTKENIFLKHTIRTCFKIKVLANSKCTSMCRGIISSCSKQRCEKKHSKKIAELGLRLEY